MSLHRNIIAVDLGAESGRVFLSQWDGTQARLRQVHRFSNGAKSDGDHLVWDLETIWQELLRGITAAARETDGRIDSIGIDGWGVDYVLLDREGRRIGPCFCYRDPRNPSQMQRAFSILPKERIYQITGIQFMPINTLYQLLAHTAEFPDQWDAAALFLNLPEYFLYRLSGVAIAEITNASTTQMLEVSSRSWSRELSDAFGWSRDKFPTLVEPGTVLGELRPDLQSELRLQGAQIIAPACHDTGSAVAGIPFPQDESAFISSGTWSLVGTSLQRPIASFEAQQLNFTNECGLGKTSRFLKNVIGLWLIQECLREWNQAGASLTSADLADMCAGMNPDGPWFDVEAGDFLTPGRMPARINAALKEKGEDETHTPVALAAIIYRSLAKRYAQVIGEIRRVTGKKLKRICIMGGGVKNETLNALTAHFSGLEIVKGFSESAAVGNSSVQIAALENDHSVERIREISALTRFIP